MSESRAERSEETFRWVLPMLAELWVHRWRILTVVVLVAPLVAFAAGWYYYTRPSERLARVEFLLVFDGADRGQYPNSSRFSRSDIIATPVLTEVYRKNELERYLPYERFKNSLFVFEANRELEMLIFEYQARLSDVRMQLAERSRIEAEFRQKLDVRRVPQLSLQFMLRGSATSPPSRVMEKVLHDILSEWADQAALQRGALGYQIEILTPSVILKDTLSSQTMLIRYDLLRRHVARVLAQINRLAALPGANTMRVGAEKLSLIDLRTNMEDLLEFQLNPLIRRRLIYALSPGEIGLNKLYLDDRILELKNVQDTARERKGQLEIALRTFTADTQVAGVETAGPPPTGQSRGAATPALSDSFLDRLLDIAGRSSAIEYRTQLTERIIAAGEASLGLDTDIAFYQETSRLLNAVAAGSRPVALVPEDVQHPFDSIQKRVLEILALTNEAYTSVSNANLNPRSGLYRLTGAYSVQLLRTTSLQTVAMVGIMAFFAIGIAAVVMVILVGQLRRFALVQRLQATRVLRRGTSPKGPEGPADPTVTGSVS